jgi:hypothetical protein
LSLCRHLAKAAGQSRSSSRSSEQSRAVDKYFDSIRELLRIKTDEQLRKAKRVQIRDVQWLHHLDKIERGNERAPEHQSNVAPTHRSGLLTGLLAYRLRLLSAAETYDCRPRGMICFPQVETFDNADIGRRQVRIRRKANPLCTEFKERLRQPRCLKPKTYKVLRV